MPGASGPDSQPLYDRLKDALEALGPDGARAVLWHQGESDNELNTSTTDYIQRLEAIIDQSRIDAGFDIPWGIAQASFDPNRSPMTQQSVINAQALVATNDPLNFVGAFTDDLTGTMWRHDGIHFNEAGLIEHADRWFDQLNATFYAIPEPGSFALLGVTGVLAMMHRRSSTTRRLIRVGVIIRSFRESEGLLDPHHGSRRSDRP